jgi:flagellum-specific ATP synthase
LIRLGAYKQGSDPKVDEAIHYFAGIEEFLRQKKEEHMDLEECYATLAQILDMNYQEEALPELPEGANDSREGDREMI